MIAVDTNILIYAELPDQQDVRHGQSVRLLTIAALHGAILPLQVVGEFLNVCRTKKVLAADVAAGRASLYFETFDVIPTEPPDLIAAATLSASRQLQYFDALIITVAARAGASVLLSEDMQDGLVVAGLMVVDPFAPANAARLAALFAA